MTIRKHRKRYFLPVNQLTSSKVPMYNSSVFAEQKRKKGEWNVNQGRKKKNRRKGTICS